MNQTSEKTAGSGLLSRARNLVLIAGAALGGLLLILTFVNGSYAMWSDTTRVEPGTITIGSAALEAMWEPEHDPGLWADLLPDQPQRQGFELSNTGTTPLQITVTAITGASGLEVRVAAEACGSDALTAVTAQESAQPLPAPDSTPLVLDSETSITGCIEVTLTGESAPGEQHDFLVRFDGTQVVTP